MRRESKAELMDRLRREARWDAFVKRREELRAGGTAAADAWRLVAAEFPPLAPTPPASGNGDGSFDLPADLRCLRDKSPATMLDAVTWVFESLDAPWVRPADAPSIGAWSLREWARQNAATRAEFYTTFVPKLMPTRNQLGGADEKFTDDGRDVLKLIEAALAAGDPNDVEPPVIGGWQTSPTMARDEGQPDGGASRV